MHHLKVSKKKTEIPPEGSNFPESDMLTFTNSAMKIYGQEVNLDRAVPDFRDGLKPVTRRIIHVAASMAKSSKVKTARLSGEVMGLYHPHGNCLGGETLVYTLDGEFTPIKDMIGKGRKWVLAWDYKSSKLVPALAHSWRVGQKTKKIFKVYLTDGSIVRCTGEHPFLVKDEGWIFASNLTSGQELSGATLSTNSAYYTVRLPERSAAVHSVVSSFFEGEIESGEVVHHKNENKTDNRPHNLTVITRSQHHSVEHRDTALEGLANGRKTMFDSKSPMRKAIRQKNSALLRSHNEWLWLIKAIKVARYARDKLRISKKEFGEKVYVETAKRMGIYNATKPITLLRRKIDWVKLWQYIDTWSMPTEAAVGFTEKFKIDKDAHESNICEETRLGQLCAKAMHVIRYALRVISVSELNFDSYEFFRKKFVEKNLDKSGCHVYPKSLTLRKYWVSMEDCLKDGVAHGLFVKKVVIVDVNLAENMYDFTVDDYENMMIAARNEHGRYTLCCVHNSSIEGAVSTLVDNSVFEITGLGSWSNFNTPPSAARYTECLLSGYGQQFAHTDYYNKAVTDFSPNYDDSTMEPLVLPCRFPNILLNGSEGIGLGISLCIPAFTPESLLKILADMCLRPKTVSKKIAATSLIFSNQWGGYVEKSKANRLAMLDLMDNPTTSIRWTCDVEVDESAKTITLRQFFKGINIDKLQEKIKDFKLNGVYVVQTIGDLTGKFGKIIYLKKTVSTNDLHKVSAAIQKNLTSNVRYAIYVTERLIDPNDSRRYDVKFYHVSLWDLMLMWLRWRIQLETRSLNYRIDQVNRAIALNKLLLFVIANLDAIIKIIKESADAKADLMKKFKLTDEQAEQILERKLRSLTKMEKSKLELAIKELQTKLADLQKRLKDPRSEVGKFLEASIPYFSEFVNDRAFTQFKLKNSVNSPS